MIWWVWESGRHEPVIPTVSGSASDVFSPSTLSSPAGWSLPVMYIFGGYCGHFIISNSLCEFAQRYQNSFSFCCLFTSQVFTPDLSCQCLFVDIHSCVHFPLIDPKWKLQLWNENHEFSSPFWSAHVRFWKPMFLMVKLFSFFYDALFNILFKMNMQHRGSSNKYDIFFRLPGKHQNGYTPALRHNLLLLWFLFFSAATKFWIPFIFE